VEKTAMKTATTLVLAAITCLTACTTTARQNAGSPPPFECTSIHPEVCELEEQFHKLRFEQAEQISAIEEAERKRKTQTKTAGAVAANAVPAS
jgi:Spy/CpxP family protein refolding chaperone